MVKLELTFFSMKRSVRQMLVAPAVLSRTGSVKTAGVPIVWKRGLLVEKFSLVDI